VNKRKETKPTIHNRYNCGELNMATNNSEAEAKENMYEDLYVKACEGNIPEFQRMQNLPKHQFDINWAEKDYGDTFLRAASVRGHAKLVSYLLDNGAIIDSRRIKIIRPTLQKRKGILLNRKLKKKKREKRRIF